jgi:hypothetical protein
MLDFSERSFGGGGLLDDEPKNIDLSGKSFDQFVEFFFNREVVSEDKLFYCFATDLAGERYDEAVPSSPTILVKHMTKLFSEFGKIAPKYSLAQIDQGIWGILGPSFHSLYDLVFADSVPLPNRLECIRSMYYVYSDFVANSEAEPDPNLSGFFMWWDFLLHGFWTPPRPLVPGTFRGDASKLDAESRIMLDVMFETLKRILDLRDTETQRCALHGLGHLDHPEVHDTVQRYIDANKSDLPSAWLEECRDGNVQ